MADTLNARAFDALAAGRESDESRRMRAFPFIEPMLL
jgi:hypothetical protein